MSGPRLIMTLLVRDEDDIVADNVAWHLSHGVDHVVATDNASTDGTREALAAFARDGVLTLLDEASDAYLQDVWHTRMALMARDTLGADWVLCNDADEFWRAPSGNLKDVLPERGAPPCLLSCERRNMIAPRDALGSKHWAETLVYTPTLARTVPSSPKSLSGLRDTAFERSYFEHRLPPKLLIPTAGLARVERGAHVAHYDGPAPETLDCPVEILHFPIRSRARFEASVRRIAGAVRRIDALPVTTSWKYRRWLQMTEEAGSIWPAFREVLPDRRTLRHELAEGRLREDRSFARAMRRMRGEDGTPAPVPPPAPAFPDGGHLTLVAGADAHAATTATGLLERLGAAPPLPGWPDALTDVQGAILAGMGRDEQDMRPASASWFEQPDAAVAAGTLGEAVTAAFDDLAAGVLGDARTGPLMRLWRDVGRAQDLGLSVVLVVTDPATTAKALQAEDGLPLAAATLVWAARLLDAERHSRGLPRIAVREADLTAEWSATADEIEDALGRPWLRSHRAPAEEIDAFVRDRARKTPISEDALMALPGLSDIVRETHEAMQALTAGADPGDLAPVFDDIVGRLEGAGHAFGPALEALARERARLVETAHRAEAARHDSEREVTKLRKEMRAKANWLRDKFEREQARAAEALSRAEAAEEALRKADAKVARVDRKRAKTVADRDAAKARTTRLELLLKCRKHLSHVPPRGLRARLRERREADAIRTAPAFDAEWYVRTYRDVARNGVDPALHYLRHGAREGRNPGPNFDTLRYYAEYPEVLDAGRNALLDHIEHGERQARQAFPVESSD